MPEWQVCTGQWEQQVSSGAISKNSPGRVWHRQFPVLQLQKKKKNKQNTTLFFFKWEFITNLSKFRMETRKPKYRTFKKPFYTMPQDDTRCVFKKILTHLKTPFVNFGQTIILFFEIRLLLSIFTTFSWRLCSCEWFGLVRFHASRNRFCWLRLGHTFTSRQFVTVAAVCWRNKKTLLQNKAQTKGCQKLTEPLCWFSYNGNLFDTNPLL